MGSTLEALHRLQEVELQIAEIRQGLERKTRLVKRQQGLIAELSAKIAAQQNAIRADQIEADRLDLDVKAREAEIAKLRQALNASKTNKEYSAVLTQLNTSKADNSKLEEKVLAMLTLIDGKKKALASLQGELAAETAKLGELLAGRQQAEAQVKQRLDALTAQREEAAAAVPKQALDVFNRVAAKNEGQAMAPVTRTHPKRAEYACGGCHMSINIEQVNAIMSRNEAIVCGHCGHILYLEEPAASGSR